MPAGFSSAARKAGAGAMVAAAAEMVVAVAVVEAGTGARVGAVVCSSSRRLQRCRAARRLSRWSGGSLAGRSGLSAQRRTGALAKCLAKCRYAGWARMVCTRF